jgi:hypothetical protein
VKGKVGIETHRGRRKEENKVSLCRTDILAGLGD